jgi:periplasmic divalent cation tolerance protein
MSGCCQITTVVGEQAAAHDLANTLVTERLAACAQIIGPIRSVYRWERAVERALEWMVVAKTTEARAPELIARIRALHQYAVPEIVAQPIGGGLPEYLQWVERETTPLPPEPA